MTSWTSECGTVTLHHGDCMEVLPTLEHGSIDMLLTDPPYGNDYSTGYRQRGLRADTKIHNDLLCRPLLNDVAELCRPLLNDVAAIYWFAAPNRLDWIIPIISTRWEMPNVLCWDKGNCTAGDLDGTYGKQWEAIVFGRTKRTPLLGGRDRDIINISRGDVGSYHHPTQKPVPLMTYLMCRHDATTVLDPFMGSGSAGVAAVQLGRKFIGVELDATYFETAKRRIQEELAIVQFLSPNAMQHEQMELAAGPRSVEEAE